VAFLRIPSPTIAEQHAKVRFYGKDWEILDDEASSGLFVNGEQVTLRVLRDGDELRLGDVRLRVLLDPVEPVLRLVALGPAGGDRVFVLDETLTFIGRGPDWSLE
jgi:pSer/pThr/pTyr-binding forkhead associated (FHA) protein